MNHVIFAGGYELPTVQTALKWSADVMTFLSICIIGNSVGNSTICILAIFIAVWNNGASADTSQWYWPDSPRVTLRNVTDVESDIVNYIFKGEKNIQL